MSCKSIRKLFGVVTQDIVLFDGTIKDNLIMFSENILSPIGMSEIVDACKVAFIHNFITTLPQGYNSKIGEKGVKLSGGQKQRLAIARAILYKPSVLVLDEATSHLDNESEQYIKKALKSLNGKMTMIVIAHRLSTVTDLDRICIMESGKITEEGKHEELLKKSQVYKKMWSISNEN